MIKTLHKFLSSFRKTNFRFFLLMQIFSAVIYFVLAAYISLLFYRVEREDSDTICRRAVADVSGKITNFFVQGFESLIVASDAVDFLIQNDASDETIQKYFSSAINVSDNFETSSYAPLYGLVRGKYFDGTDWIPPDDYVPKERDWFINALRSGRKPTLVPPYLDARTNLMIFSVARLLSDYSSVVALDLASDDFQHFIDELSIGKNGFGFIIDNSSLILAHSDKNFCGKLALRDETVPADLRSLCSTVLSSQKKQFTTYFNGEKCVAFSSKILDDWNVVMVLPLKTILQKLKVSISKIVVLFLLICAFTVFQMTQTFKRKVELEQVVGEQSEKINEQSKLMLDMQTNIIEELATLIEARDANTGEHVKNTKVYSVMIAKMLYMKKIHRDEISKKFIADLGMAAPLHDIGKITVPDSILLKRGKFSDFEYETMKNHTRFGGAIIRRIFKNFVDRDAVQMAVDVAQYHHERWDGKGYPLQMKGEEIPLSARILAVADCFDALVSERCYKPAMPREKAFRMISEESGTHFDPEIVEIFLSLRPKIELHLDKIQKESGQRVTEI